MQYLRWLRPLVVVASLVLGASGCRDTGQSTGTTGGVASTSLQTAVSPCGKNAVKVSAKPTIDLSTHQETLIGKACLAPGFQLWVGEFNGSDAILLNDGDKDPLNAMTSIVVDDGGGWTATVPYIANLTGYTGSSLVAVAGGSGCAAYLQRTQKQEVLPNYNLYSFKLSVESSTGDRGLRSKGCMQLPVQLPK